MTKFVQGVQSLFGGGGGGLDELKAEQAKSREAQSIQLDQQKSQLQNAEAEADLQAGAVKRVPRGRRLLLAATGEAGLSSKLG